MDKNTPIISFQFGKNNSASSDQLVIDYFPINTHPHPLFAAQFPSTMKTNPDVVGSKFPEGEGRVASLAHGD